MAAPGTKQKLLSLVEDVEILSKELLDCLATPKAQRSDDIDTSQLVDLLVQKKTETQDTLQTAREQADLQKKRDALKVEVDKRDQDIKQLQKNLKEAETILATAIYQAKQKLKSINQATKRKISAEELIKYAHKISASNAVAAPPTWEPGDQRRPYPTEVDMRMGLLGRRSDLPAPPMTLQSQTGYHEGIGRSQSQLEHALSTPAQGQGGPQLTWQHSMDMSGAVSASGLAMDSKSHAKDADDVELMSTDSSSSSSSDE